MTTATQPTGSAQGAASLLVGDPWAGVRRLLERASGLHELRVHRLQLLEAQRRRELDQPIPDDLAAEALSSVRATLLAHALLSRLRDLCEGPIMVIKGPEVAASYPAAWLRPYVDVDILVPEARDTERRLRSAGFTGVGPGMDFDALHHVQRLAAPDTFACVEVHRRPKWIGGGSPPTFEELLADAVPSATGIDGLLAPNAANHAVLLAAHAWAERPLGRLGDLVDVAAMLQTAPRDACAQLADRYELGRVWRATLALIDGVIVRPHRTWSTSTWARHLPRVRERTVFESHLARLLEPFAAAPPQRAFPAAIRRLGRTVRPQGGEAWGVKIARTGKALRDAGVSVSAHERSLASAREDEQ